MAKITLAQYEKWLVDATKEQTQVIGRHSLLTHQLDSAAKVIPELRERIRELQASIPGWRRELRMVERRKVDLERLTQKRLAKVLLARKIHAAKLRISELDRDIQKVEK